MARIHSVADASPPASSGAREAMRRRWEGFADDALSLFQPGRSQKIMLRDEIMYTLGVGNVMLMAFFTGGHQYVLPLYYAVKFPFLLSTRIVIFSARRWGYYLFDFCYVVNVGLFVYVLSGAPDWVLKVLYSLAHGPLGIAAVLFRNSLVFHSIDFWTSCYLHGAPMLVTIVIRWNAGGNEDFVVSYQVDENPQGFRDLAFTFVVPMVAYLIWGMCYILVAAVLCPVPSDDQSYQTIMRQLVVSEKGALHFITEWWGGEYTPVFYVLLNIVFVTCSLLPTILFYNYEWLNWSFLAIIIVTTIWNGSTYYVEVFARRYMQSLKDMSDFDRRGTAAKNRKVRDPSVERSGQSPSSGNIGRDAKETPNTEDTELDVEDWG